jgi:protein involved in polysaccharide export with SLBB domain
MKFVISFGLLLGSFVTPFSAQDRQEKATVSVLGEVRRPGSYQALNALPLTQVIALAGGLTPHADRKSIEIGRVGKDPVIVDLGRILRGSSVDVQIQPGETIIVPRIKAWLLAK